MQIGLLGIFCLEARIYSQLVASDLCKLYASWRQENYFKNKLKIDQLAKPALFSPQLGSIVHWSAGNGSPPTPAPAPFGACN